MIRLILCLSLILYLVEVKSQDRLTPDHSKLESWVAQYRNYFYSDHELGRIYLDSIQSQLLEKTDTAIYWQAKYKSELAYSIARTFDYPKTIELLRESLAIYKSFDNKLEEAAIESRIGSAYLNYRDYDSALYYISSGLEKNQQMGNEARVNRSLGDMFIVYFYKAEYDQALTYILKHLDKSLELQDTVAMPQAYTNLAATFYRLNEYDSSKKYHFKSLEWAKIKAYDLDIGYCYLNLGEIYSNEGQLDSSLYYHQKAQELFTQLNFKTGLNSNSLNLAKLLVKKNQESEALQYVEASIKMSEEGNDLALLRDALDVKIAIEKRSNRFKEALATLEKINVVQDSLDQRLNKSTLDELIAKYESKEMKQALDLQSSQLNEQEAIIERNQILLIASAVLAILILIITLLWINRSKKKQDLLLKEERIKSREAEISAAISSQEKERARYARDLHDGFGQMISILNMNLGSLKEKISPNERSKVFEESEKVINGMYDELKEICFDLMPQTLIKNGLQTGLEEFAQRVNKPGKVFIETNFFGLESRLSEVQEIALYRISQEWINNILKYSDADKITLQITKDEEEITLLIEDNGDGFDKSVLTNSKGNGWKNLNTRSNLIKGTLELETQNGKKGTTLIVNVPMQAGVEALENTIEMV